MDEELIDVSKMEPQYYTYIFWGGRCDGQFVYVLNVCGFLSFGSGQYITKFGIHELNLKTPDIKASSSDLTTW